jgi:HEAT repeat protein
MGPKAVPSLRRMLRTRDTKLRLALVSYCSKRPWFPLHFRPPAYRLQIRGLFGIGALGATAKAAVPELVILLHSADWTIRAWAAGDLGKIGPEASTATPDLVAVLGDRDEHVRAAACGALVAIGARKEGMLPGLMTCLRDTNDAVFSAALAAASSIGVEPPMLVPVVTDQLKQTDPRVRYEAAMALGRNGDKARSAIPELLKAIQDTDKDVREAAAGALSKIDPSMALDIYKAIAGVELVMKFQGPVPGLINLRATRPLSPKEAMDFLEKALLEQAGIVLERIDEKHVAVKMRHQK